MGVNTSQEGDKCHWKAWGELWAVKGMKCSERSVPGMKWKVAEYSGMNELLTMRGADADVATNELEWSVEVRNTKRKRRSERTGKKHR